MSLTMTTETLDYIYIRRVRNQLVDSLKQWESPDGFYTSSPLTREKQPSFTCTGIVLQAYNEAGKRAWAQSLAEKLLRFLEDREYRPFPQEKSLDIKDEKPHVMSNSWAAFALLDCYPIQYNKIWPICKWFLDHQRVNDHGWSLFPGEETHYPAIDAYALRTLIKYYRSCQRLDEWKDREIQEPLLERNIIDAVDNLKKTRIEQAKFNNLYLWPSSNNNLGEKGRVSFGTSALCMHVIAKASQVLQRSEWEENVVHTLEKVCDAYRQGEEDSLRILDQEIDLWERIEINETPINYTWSFFAPICLTTLSMYAERLKEQPGYFGLVRYLSQWILNNTQPVRNGVGVRGDKTLPEVKVWSTGLSVVALSRVLDKFHEISQVTVNTERGRELKQNSVAADSITRPVDLCLSGGGYRAMLFHLGVLWRLTQAGYLQRFNNISSVSGGSITAGMLAKEWRNIISNDGNPLQAFIDRVVAPIRQLASKTIDGMATVSGKVWPFTSAANLISRYYNLYLFNNATLQDLPSSPTFIFNATNVQNGERFSFSKTELGDKLIGKMTRPKTLLSVAVAASSAFPPFLSPLILSLPPDAITKGSGTMQGPPYTVRVVLTDGGVYDNLGLDPVSSSDSSLLVSDGGALIKPIPYPSSLWTKQFLRTIELIDNQVRCLRRENLFKSLQHGIRQGAYWSIGSHVEHFSRWADTLIISPENTATLSNIPTRLKAISLTNQEKLINWGYAVCDAAIRTRIDETLPNPDSFPYPESGV